MPTIAPGTSLGSLVTEHPGLAGQLDRFGLDYCCGGQRSLADAVESAGLDLTEVVTALECEEPGPGRADWADLDPTQLVDHLETTHHAYLHASLPRLTDLATKVADVHGDRHPELTEVCRLVAELCADLEPHLRNEEQVLFPMVRELAVASTAPSFDGASLRRPISAMMIEHDRVGELLVELRTASGEYLVPDDGCASYRALYDGLMELERDTHLHVHKENNVLFPAVLATETAITPGAT